MDAVSISYHMVKAPPLEKDEYAKFYKIGGGVNEIQHIQRSLIEIAEEQSKEEVWSKVISWEEKGQLPEKAGD